MKKIVLLTVITAMIGTLTGCATLKDKLPPIGIDSTAQRFFDDLQKSDNRGAYGLLGKGLSQRVSFDQFDGFMQSVREHWGRLETDETALMPFHKRQGESGFIPLNVPPEQIKRYIFDVKFENAEMNFDLTLAPEGDGYKIVWFSIWGSSIYINGPMREKIANLFSNQ
jgi:hypothetical protein